MTVVYMLPRPPCFEAGENARALGTLTAAGATLIEFGSNQLGTWLLQNDARLYVAGPALDATEPTTNDARLPTNEQTPIRIVRGGQRLGLRGAGASVSYRLHRIGGY